MFNKAVDWPLLIGLFVTEYKRARQEIKKKSSDTLKLQKKAKKGEKKLFVKPFAFDVVVHVCRQTYILLNVF